MMRAKYLHKQALLCIATAQLQCFKGMHILFAHLFFYARLILSDVRPPPKLALSNNIDNRPRDITANERAPISQKEPHAEGN